MKRYIFLTAVLLISVQTMSAQTITDALNLSTRYYDGTARSLGMGNAMTALGGDLGALSYNPAASGLYRYSEITLTPSLSGFTGQTSYSGNTAHNSRMRLSLSNIGWVSGIETGRRNGLVSVNFAIATNQTNNFVYRTSASGVEAQTSFLASLAANIPDGVTGGDLTMPEDYPESPFMRGVASWSAILGWNAGLIDTLAGFDGFLGATENVVADDKGNVWVGVPGDLNQKYYKERSGYVQDVVFNASANISNRFFFGLNLTLQSIWMSEYSSYSEYAADPSLFQTGFENVTSEYLYNISGMGVKVDAGFIAHPVAGLTVGASVSTPTWMFLNDSYEEKMSGYTKDYGSNSLSYSTTGSFRLMSPFRFNVGVGYTFGSYLALGVDYERADYGMMKYSDNSGRSDSYQYENQSISDIYRATNNLRAGIEVRAIPQTSLRLGYNYCQSPYERDKEQDRHYASAGIGFRSKTGNFFVDAAYQQQCNSNESSYTMYSDYAGLSVPALMEKSYSWRVLLTVGFRF